MLIYPSDIYRVQQRERRLARKWIIRMSAVSFLWGVIVGVTLYQLLENMS